MKSSRILVSWKGKEVDVLFKGIDEIKIMKLEDVDETGLFLTSLDYDNSWDTGYYFWKNITTIRPHEE